MKVYKEVSTLKTTHITSIDTIYPDVSVNESTVYIRGDIKLKLLLLLYDKIILYIPPADENYFFNRFGINFTDLLTLCRKNVIIPLIAHPTDYTLPHFKELLDLKPPSVWARGISLVKSFNMDFDEAERRLPLKRIAGFQSVRKQWRGHYPQCNEEQLTANIIREISTLYADLVVFGHHGVIDNLLDVGIPDQQIVYYLKTLNEFLTYPALFGLGGIPVFDSEKIKDKFSINLSSLNYKMKKAKVVCPSLQYILEKLDIYLQDVGMTKIIEFRRDGYVKKLQNAIKDIQMSGKNMYIAGNIDANTVVSHSIALEKAINDFNAQLDSDIPYKIKSLEIGLNKRILNGTINLGGLSLGNIAIKSKSGESIDLTTLSQFEGFSLIDLYPPEFKRLIVGEEISNQISPIIATLWEVRSKLYDH
jgi:hypothetical protein